MKTVDPTKMTVEELKALAYDVMVQIQIGQNNLNSLNNEIAKRQTPEEGKVEKK